VSSFDSVPSPAARHPAADPRPARPDAAAGPIHIIGTLVGLIAIVALPVAVITSVVLGLIFDASFYHDGQVRYEVQRVTRMTQDQMDRVDRGIVRFFAGTESLPDALVASGAPGDVYQEKEVLHMNDVRGLIRGIRSLQVAALGVVAVLLVLTGLTWRRGGREILARAFLLSSLLTVALTVVVGVLTLTSFDSLFLTFHHLSFSNDFWQLDPRTDHLIQMFPFEFWYDAMLTVAIRVVVVTVVVGVAGFVLRQAGKAQRRWT
jgi:integral membrane protein (TIGR01906 family)